MRDIIAHERRVELAFENHRWHDLVRTGKTIDVMTAYGEQIKQKYDYLIMKAIKDSGMDQNTIIIFTADHGDLLGAHGFWDKQQPFEESIRVPFLIHYPAVLGTKGKSLPLLINSPDIMPTLLGLCGIKIPGSVEGVDFSGVLKGTERDRVTCTLISCVQPFGQWSRLRGGREYRGIVTERYTYVRDLNGPWLFFDNATDPFQMSNLIGDPKFSKIEKRLDKMLHRQLKERNDEFRPGLEYVRMWNYTVDDSGTVPYKEINFRGEPIVE